MAALLKDFARSYYAPRMLYRDIAQGHRSRSWVYVLLYCLIYVVGSLWLYAEGYSPFVSPWLVIPQGSYYLVQAFYIVPLVFLMWILATGVISVLARFAGGRGAFHRLLEMSGFSLWAPWYPLIIVDVIHATPEWLYNVVLALCMLLILRGTTVAVMEEERVGLFPAFGATAAAFVSIGLILFTYIR